MTIRQPWAEWIIAGEKEVENRTWSTSHLGMLGTHAGRSVATLRQMASDPADFVFGAVVGAVELWMSSAIIPADRRTRIVGTGW